MKFFEIIAETKFAVNRNPIKGTWQLRMPEPGTPLVDEAETVILSNAQPWAAPHDEEKKPKITHFIVGDEVKVSPQGKGRPIGYIRERGHNPFVYMDTHEPYEGSSYAVFDGKRLTAYEN